MLNSGKILILGSANLDDARILVEHGGIAGDRLIVTELRERDELAREYSNFQHNYDQLIAAGALIKFGIDALCLNQLPTEQPVELSAPECKIENSLAKADLQGVSHIIWCSPYFGKSNEPRFPTLLKSFFEGIKQLFPTRTPHIYLALDCISSDALYNLNTRFGIFNIPNWVVTSYADLRKFYKFSATDSHGHIEDGRVGLTYLQSDRVQLLEFVYDETKYKEALTKMESAGPWEYCTHFYNRQHKLTEHESASPDDDECDCKTAHEFREYRKKKNQDLDCNPTIVAGKNYQTLYSLDGSTFEVFCHYLNSSGTDQLSAPTSFAAFCQLAKRAGTVLTNPIVSFAEAFHPVRNTGNKPGTLDLGNQPVAASEIGTYSSIFHPAPVRPTNTIRRTPTLFSTPNRTKKIHAESRQVRLGGVKHTPPVKIKATPTQLNFADAAEQKHPSATEKAHWQSSTDYATFSHANPFIGLKNAHARLSAMPAVSIHGSSLQTTPVCKPRGS